VGLSWCGSCGQALRVVMLRVLVVVLAAKVLDAAWATAAG
jgi:hypothetical protein